MMFHHFNRLFCSGWLIRLAREKNIQPIIVRASEPLSPSLNLSIEMWLSQNFQVPVCFIRTSLPGVIIGKNQLAMAECDLHQMQEDGVESVRRESGGGAVYLDMGNLMVTMMGNHDQINTLFCYETIINAISHVFSVDAQFGRNNLLVRGHKVGDFFYRLSGEHFVGHAFISVNTNLTKLPGYLTQSHHMTNLSQVASSIDQPCEEFEDVMVREFVKKVGYPVDDVIVSANDINDIPEVAEMRENYSDPSHFYGGPVIFNMRLEKQFHWSRVELYFQVTSSGGAPQFKLININTDCLDLDMLPHMRWLASNCDDLAKYTGPPDDQLIEFYDWLKNELDLKNEQCHADPVWVRNNPYWVRKYQTHNQTHNQMQMLSAPM